MWFGLCLLQKLSSEFKPLTSRVQLLRALHQDVAVYLQRDTELEMRAHLGTLDAQLVELRQHCDVMCVKLEQRAQQQQRYAGVADVVTSPHDTDRYVRHRHRFAIPFPRPLAALPPTPRRRRVALQVRTPDILTNKQRFLSYTLHFPTSPDRDVVSTSRRCHLNERAV